MKSALMYCLQISVRKLSETGTLTLTARRTVYQEPMTHRLLLIPYALRTSIVNRDKYTKMLATPLTIALYWAIGVNRHYPLWLSRLVIPSTKYRVHSSLRITNSRLSKWYVNIHGGCRTRCERCCPSSSWFK